MNTRLTYLVLIAGMFASTAYASPSPVPIDAGMEDLVASNNNLACSTGSCDTSLILTGKNSTVNAVSNQTSSAGSFQRSWTPIVLLTSGGIALSTVIL